LDLYSKLSIIKMYTYHTLGLESLLWLEKAEREKYDQFLKRKKQLPKDPKKLLHTPLETKRELAEEFREVIEPFLNKIGLHITWDKGWMIPVSHTYHNDGTLGFQIRCNGFLIHSNETKHPIILFPKLTFYTGNIIKAKSQLSLGGERTFSPLLDIVAKTSFKRAEGIYVPKIKNNGYVLEVASIEHTRRVAITLQAIMRETCAGELKLMYDLKHTKPIDEHHAETLKEMYEERVQLILNRCQS